MSTLQLAQTSRFLFMQRSNLLQIWITQVPFSNERNSWGLERKSLFLCKVLLQRSLEARSSLMSSMTKGLLSKRCWLLERSMRDSQMRIAILVFLSMVNLKKMDYSGRNSILFELRQQSYSKVMLFGFKRGTPVISSNISLDFRLFIALYVRSTFASAFSTSIIQTMLMFGFPNKYSNFLSNGIKSSITIYTLSLKLPFSPKYRQQKPSSLTSRTGKILFRRVGYFINYSMAVTKFSFAKECSLRMQRKVYLLFSQILHPGYTSEILFHLGWKGNSAPRAYWGGKQLSSNWSFCLWRELTSMEWL